MTGNHTEETEKCPECGGTRFENDGMRGEKICSMCGCVIDESIIDLGPDWRSFSNMRDRERIGAPLSIMSHDKGLTTDIANGCHDAHGAPIPSKNMAQIRRLRTWQKRMRVSNALERNLATAISHINRISMAMELGFNVREMATMDYKMSLKRNLVRGRTIESVVTACLYAASRQCGTPRTLDEVAKASGVEKKVVARTYRVISRQLKLNLKPTKPEDYLQRFCTELEVSEEVRRRALGILRDIGDREASYGHAPIGAAAAAIYISCILCHEYKTQRAIARVAGVTEVTVRTRYRELTTELGIAA